MELLIYLIALAIVVGAVVLSVKRTISIVTVWEYQRGLRYYKGRYQRLLEPGQYWIWKYSTHIERVDMRPRQMIVSGQEVLSADAIALKVSIVAVYQVIDAVAAVNKIENYSDSLYALIQLALREVVGSKPIDDLLENRNSLNTTLMGQCGTSAEEFGLKLLSVSVRDIMFPGDLKNVFAQPVKARKEGEAALEKARGETAALRNLANAAKLMDKNPALLQLRALQTMEKSGGNTIVMGVPAQEGMIRLKRDDEPL
ncbi:MAG: slipin family protein [Desulfomonilaceae bacterium]|nr:slipin family protein [Desulfomonilaceae bacterium]